MIAQVLKVHDTFKKKKNYTHLYLNRHGHLLCKSCMRLYAGQNILIKACVYIFMCCNDPQTVCIHSLQILVEQCPLGGQWDMSLQCNRIWRWEGGWLILFKRRTPGLYRLFSTLVTSELLFSNYWKTIFWVLSGDKLCSKANRRSR